MKHIKAFENFFNQQDLGRFSDDESNFNDEFVKNDEENCAPCNPNFDDETEETHDGAEEKDVDGGIHQISDEESEDEEDWGDKKVINPGGPMIEKFNSFLERKKEKGKTPKNEKEKELAKKYGDPKKITKGDFIAAAIENKKKGEKKEDEKDSKASDKQKKKLPPALLKAIEAKKK